MNAVRRARELRWRLADTIIDAHDAKAMQALAALSGPFLPWTTFSMRPPAILAVVSDIAIHQRRTIVECGSGNSTIYAARLLAQRGSERHITTIEHDAEWEKGTSSQLERDGLAVLMTVVHAPLVKGWYDRSAIPQIADIDLLVVDGPPAQSADTRMARQPALAVFHPALTGDATVILDDARRRGERKVLQQWSSAFGPRFVTKRGGYAISAPHTA